MELIRRLLLVLGLLGGVWTYLETTPFLVSVSVEDFARSKAQVESRPTGFIYRDKTLQEFYEGRTDGRIQRADSDEWKRLFDEVLVVTSDAATDEALRRRRGLENYADSVFFLPDEPPTDSVAGSLGEFSALVYVSIGGEGPSARTLSVVRVEGCDAGGKAPTDMLHPHRPWALWLVLVGIAGYFLLPKPSRGPGVIYYASARAIVMPDLLGAGLLAFFFWIPIMVTTSNGASLLDFEDGWWILGAVFCFLSIAPLVILANWRAMLPAVMFEQGQGVGLEFVLRNGSRERLWLSALLGWAGMIEGLPDRGVHVPGEVRELAQQCLETES